VAEIDSQDTLKKITGSVDKIYIVIIVIIVIAWRTKCGIVSKRLGCIGMNVASLYLRPNQLHCRWRHFNQGYGQCFKEYAPEQKWFREGRAQFKSNKSKLNVL